MWCKASTQYRDTVAAIQIININVIIQTKSIQHNTNLDILYQSTTDITSEWTQCMFNPVWTLVSYFSVVLLLFLFLFWWWGCFSWATASTFSFSSHLHKPKYTTILLHSFIKNLVSTSYLRLERSHSLFAKSATMYLFICYLEQLERVFLEFARCCLDFLWWVVVFVRQHFSKLSYVIFKLVILQAETFYSTAQESSQR